MLLTISTTARQADDLSFLLHKHPDRVQSFNLNFGKAHIFYPEVSETRCTAAMLLDVDPIELVRGRKGGGNIPDAYVNDRPYVASSFLSVAISQVFGTALAGHCKDRSDRVGERIPLEAMIGAQPCRGGEEILRRLFEPLGYEVEARSHLLDDRFPGWGQSPHFIVSLKATCRLKDLLGHLYVLIPVMDDHKHYYVGEDEISKLLRHGEKWLAKHPEQAFITNRYLRHKHGLVREALQRLHEDEDPEEQSEEKAAEESNLEERVSLNEQRLGTVVAALKASNAQSVLDLGCGEGRLLAALMREKQFKRLAGLDVSILALERACRRLHLQPASKSGIYTDPRGERITLWHGALTYRDERLRGFDAVTLVEVIEHFDPGRLRALERVVFECARPRRVIITTPNREYNVRFASLPAGTFRHRDHRFEWTREEFHVWAERIAVSYGAKTSFVPIGPADDEVGAPTQMAVFDLD